MIRIFGELPAVEVAGRKLVGRVVFGLLVMAAALVGAFTGLLAVYSTDLPEISELEHYRPSAVTELYDDQGRVLGSFAIQRRVIVGYDDLPPVLRQAVISVEDKDFEKHWGINWRRVLGAFYRDVISRRRAQGASTLTMQLSRNLFLSQERTLGRKAQEAMLAIQIERRFTKPQIFTMYCNQIYLGHGSYGFEAGSEYYFSKHARDLTLPEAALLAGLPKSPNDYSPILHPDRSVARRNLVLNSLLEDGKITAEEATRAKNTPLKLEIAAQPNSLAPWFVEEVRRYLERKYGSDRVHQGGLRVYTSLNLELQKAASVAVLDGLAAYEHRHGWKGHLENIVYAGGKLAGYQHPDWDNPIAVGGYEHALVTAVSPVSASVKIGRYTAVLGPSDVAWTGKRSPQKSLTVGDIAYVRITSLGPDGKATAKLEQDSGAQGALLAMDNATGDIKAMVGGRDYDNSQFNRATQALRQVGSSFKPYVYTAAIDAAGVSPDDLILDAPTIFVTPGGPYSPHNYDGKFEGNITVRHALAESRNVPTVKLAERMGMKTVIDYARKFGITSPLPPYLPVALGAAEVTLWEQTAAFTTFPNDGVRVTPRFIRKVEDYDGHVLEENYPEVKDVINVNTARIMTSLLEEVTTHGTAASASQLKHAIAGKTGTTNDFTDAWFVGFSPSITCGVWIGFDEKKTLGPRESGAEAALPVWMEFMRTALQGRDGEQFAPAPTLPHTPGSLALKEDTPEIKPGEVVITH